LGYDVDPRGPRLVINAEEAIRVRAIFALYLEYQGLTRVVRELEQYGWWNKSWQTRKGKPRGGKSFTKVSLHHLLTNVIYAGKIRYKKEVHAGEHAAIVDPETWQQVQELLGRHDPAKGSKVRNPSLALLKGILHCRPCGCAMTPTQSCKNGSKRYRYYVCLNALRRGQEVCRARSVPAAAIEQFVIERIQEFTRDQGFTAGDMLTAGEQADSVQRLVQRVDYDGAQGKVAITFQPASQPGKNGVPST
jgi:site-specific DNA recombinase